MELPPVETLKNKYDEVVSRLPKFIDRGFVASIDTDGTYEHQGDSLLFSGLALYALDCHQGQPIADGFVKMLTDLDGGAYRHPDLADSKRPNDELSLDGLLGLYRGVAKRVLHCGEKDLWAPLFVKHKQRVQASLPGDFGLVCDMLLYRLGLKDAPDPSRVDALNFVIVSWAKLVKARKAAAYRIHLGLLSLQTLEELGLPVRRGAFAEVTDGLRLATADHFSGRPGLDAWLEAFEFDKWEYAHQRCPLWEVPDGAGMSHAGIDFLVGFSDLYGAPK